MKPNIINDNANNNEIDSFFPNNNSFFTYLKLKLINKRNLILDLNNAAFEY